MYYFPDEFFHDLKQFLSLPSSHNSHTLTSHDFDPKDPLNRLKMVKFDRKEDFCIFLSLLILTDQILYTYDKENYAEFEAKYNLPKPEFCGHGRVTNYPFSIPSYLSVTEDTFLFQTTFFFKHFITPNLNEKQKEIFFKAIQEDEDLEKDMYGRVVRFVGRREKY
jgi:hypothetical protein